MSEEKLESETMIQERKDDAAIGRGFIVVLRKILGGAWKSSPILLLLGLSGGGGIGTWLSGNPSQTVQQLRVHNDSVAGVMLKAIGRTDSVAGVMLITMARTETKVDKVLIVQKILQGAFLEQQDGPPALKKYRKKQQDQAIDPWGTSRLDDTLNNGQASAGLYAKKGAKP